MEWRMFVRRRSLKRRIAGIGLLHVGVAGIILPFLHGAIFLMLGVYVLRDQYNWAYRAVGPLERRFPRMMGRMGSMEEKSMAWMDRQIGRFRRRA
jgi:hypothetical protein